MQVGGIGSGSSGYEKSGISHQVTECIHEHGTARTRTGAAGMSASAVSFSSAAQSTNVTDASEMQTTGLLGRLQRTLGKGKHLLGRIWGSNEVLPAGEDAQDAQDMQGKLRDADVRTQALTAALPESKKHHESHIAAAASAIQAPQSAVTSNPYFTVTSDPGKVKEPFMERVKIRFRDITGYLSRFAGGRLAGRFSSGRQRAGNGQQPQQKDLRRHSRYRDKDIEVECMITDDSHLMDSYDSTGRYSRLGTENKR